MASLEVISCATTASIYARTGRLGEGRALVERGLSIGRTIELGRVALAAAGYTIGRVLGDDDLIARAGDPALIEIAFESGIVATIGRLAGPYARWLAERGRRDEARTVLRRALDALRSPYGATETLLAAAELGDPGLRGMVEPTLAILDALQAPVYGATASHLRALLQHDPTTARGYARDAAARYGALSWPYHAARCEELIGHGADALRTYRAIGAVVDVRRLELGERTPQPAAAAGLSPREWEIAELVAAGSSNRALAERLAVSQKTIEKHLTSIYDKLGFRSRSELAAFVARRG
jgi:DNA-binding NarL/FixJ family response regulator